MLYIVATPIGNLEDITFRAVRVLKEVELILAEDTRHSRVLADHCGIVTPMTSFHSFTTSAKHEALIRELKSGKTMALISDAGTPGISDPAYALIKGAIDAGVQVVPIPGAAAFLTALMASGAMTHHFTYIGFPPIKKGRQTLFKSLIALPHSIVFYESSHRLMRTLDELSVHFPERRCIVARELTKKFEEFVRGSFNETIAHFKAHPPKGEFVIVIDGV